MALCGTEVRSLPSLVRQHPLLTLFPLSSGVPMTTVEQNKVEIARLHKVIHQLQAIFIEREGQPYYPPVEASPALPPRPLDDSDFSPPSRYSHLPYDDGWDSFYPSHEDPYALPPRFPPRASYDYPYFDDYPPPRRIDQYALAPLSHFDSARYSPYSSLDRPRYHERSPAWTGQQWAPPLPAGSAQLFAPNPHHRPPPQPSLTPSRAYGDDQPFPPPHDPASSAAAASLDVTNEIFASLPKLHTDLSLQLPTTVSALLDFDPAALAVAGEVVSGAEANPAESAMMPAGKANAPTPEEQEWREMMVMTEEHL
jgi:hypothetical protein